MVHNVLTWYVITSSIVCRSIHVFLWFVLSRVFAAIGTNLHYHIVSSNDTSPDVAITLMTLTLLSTPVSIKSHALVTLSHDDRRIYSIWTPSRVFRTQWALVFTPCVYGCLYRAICFKSSDQIPVLPPKSRGNRDTVQRLRANTQRPSLILMYLGELFEKGAGSATRGRGKVKSGISYVWVVWMGQLLQWLEALGVLRRCMLALPL